MNCLLWIIVCSVIFLEIMIVSHPTPKYKIGDCVVLRNIDDNKINVVIRIINIDLTREKYGVVGFYHCIGNRCHMERAGITIEALDQFSVPYLTSSVMVCPEVSKELSR